MIKQLWLFMMSLKDSSDTEHSLFDLNNCQSTSKLYQAFATNGLGCKLVSKRLSMHTISSVVLPASYEQHKREHF